MSKIFYLAIRAEDDIAEKLRMVANLIEQKELGGDRLYADGFYKKQDFSYQFELKDHHETELAYDLLDNYRR